jgi:hypothetical protein
MLLEEADVLGGKIATDDTHQLGLGEETGRNGRMTGRTAQQEGVFRLGSLDGVQRGGTDNENAHECGVTLSPAHGFDQGHGATKMSLQAASDHP